MIALEPNRHTAEAADGRRIRPDTSAAGRLPGVPPASEAERADREATFEHDAMRRQLDAQKRELVAATERLRALEHVLGSIRLSRLYRLVRALGRWAGVDAALTYLLDESGAPFQVCGPAEAAKILHLGSHNIPRRVPVGFQTVAGIEVVNTGVNTLSLPAQHTRFWSTDARQQTLAIEIDIDGQQRFYAQIPDDRIRGGHRVPIFFPLPTASEGTHNIELTVTTAGDDSRPADRVRLGAVAYSVVSSARPARLDSLRARLFMLRFDAWPRFKARHRCARAETALAHTGTGEPRRAVLRTLKDENRRLAFMEKQARVERVASRPPYLTVDTTVACNLRCPRCYREDPVAGSVLPAEPHMSADVFQELVDTLMPKAYTINPSAWGEPLVSPYLDRLIDACESNGTYLSFTTNGVLLNKKGLLDRLVPVLHWLEISVDSVRAPLFEELRAGARFEQVMRNARLVGRIRSTLPPPAFSFGFSMTLFQENIRELPQMLDLVADCGGNFLKADIGVVFNQRHVHGSVLAAPGLYNEAVLAAERRARELGVSLFMRSPFAESGISQASRYGVCDFLYTHASIATDGSYKPCYSSVLPTRASLPKGTLRTLWNSAAMQQLRRDHDTERAPSSCSTCYMTLRGKDTLARQRERFIRLEEAH